jgi:hypothetical protein
MVSVTILVQKTLLKVRKSSSKDSTLKVKSMESFKNTLKMVNCLVSFHISWVKNVSAKGLIMIKDIS